MSPFRSLYDWYRRLSARERRVIAGGALVSVLALASAWVVLPLAHRWQEREAAIAARQTRVAQLRRLVEGERRVMQRLTARQRARSELRRRLLTGSTPALAASSLQALLQAYADTSRINLDRVDPVVEPGGASDGALPAVPVRLSGRGDIYGLTGLLKRLHRGEKLLVVDELSVNAGAVAGSQPDLLIFSMRLHGLYSPE